MRSTVPGKAGLRARRARLPHARARPDLDGPATAAAAQRSRLAAAAARLHRAGRTALRVGG